ncbi:hypothetical protein [Ferruginibacter sp. SUN106]|uniref:hypothetical protein n=1 Tax=Ferruginibacter sp. SUN106 TaxID=2978348 RepID=UPI003D365FCC
MQAVQIKEALHEYIDTADEKKLEAIYLVLKDSINTNYEYNTEELAEIYTRRNEYKSGNAQTLTTEEFMNFVRQNKL